MEMTKQYLYLHARRLKAGIFFPYQSPGFEISLLNIMIHPYGVYDV
jgi:hypothetical protein